MPQILSESEDSGLNIYNLPLEAKLTLEVSSFAQQVEINCAEYLLPPPSGVYMKNRLEPIMVDGQAYYTHKAPYYKLISNIAEVSNENIYDSNRNLIVAELVGKNINNSFQAFMRGQVFELMSKGVKCYAYKGHRFEPIKDINAVTTDVCNEAGDRIIPKHFMQNKHRFLSDTPFIPYRGVKLAELLISEQVDSVIEYCRHRGYPLHKILSHMTPLPSKEAEAYSEDANQLKQLADQLAVYQIAPEPTEHPESIILRRLEESYADLRKEINLFIGDNTWNIYLIKLNNTTVTVERYMDYRIYSWELEHGQAFRKNRGRS